MSMASSPPAAAPDSQAAIDFVRELQRDGRLLLRFITRRTDRALTPGNPAAGAVHVLTADPALIVGDRALLDTLVSTVDVLSRQAAPASASTIRLTSAYLRLVKEGGEPPPEVKRRVLRLRLFIGAIVQIAWVVWILAVAVLAHVDEGRRAVQQLQQARAELKTVNDDLGKTPKEAWIPLPSKDPPSAANEYLPSCSIAPERKDGNGKRVPPEGVRVPADGPAGAQALALCGQLYEASVREGIAFLRLQEWNCNHHKYFEGGLAFGDGCGAPPADLLLDEAKAGAERGIVRVRDWQRTEVRTAGAISKQTGFILPLLLGCIGGCAYVLRRLDHKLSDSTLEVRDGWHAMLRVVLATIMGGLLGAVWSGDQQVQLGGYTLSLAAVAFFVGFSLEAVFSFIEAMVDGVSGKLRAQPPPPTVFVAASPVPVAPTAARPGAANAGPAAGATEGATEGTPHSANEPGQRRERQQVGSEGPAV